MSVQDQIQKMKAENIKRLQEQQLKKIEDEQLRRADARNNTPVTITGLKTNELPPISGALDGNLFVLADGNNGYAYKATYTQVEQSILANVPPPTPISPASQTQQGIVELATDSEMQVAAAPPDEVKVPNPLRIFNWWAWVRTQVWTITAQWIFGIVKFNATTNALPTAGQVWFESNDLKVAKGTTPDYVITKNANSSLSYPIERVLTAAVTTGALQASYEVIEEVVTDPTIVAACTGGNYANAQKTATINPTGTTFFKGQICVDNNYLYKAIADNRVVRTLLA